MSLVAHQFGRVKFRIFQLVHDIGTSKICEFESSKSFVMIFFYLIKSRANQSGITKPFLNPNLMKTSFFFVSESLKKNQNKDLENSNILEVPMSRTSYLCGFSGV